MTADDHACHVPRTSHRSAGRDYEMPASSGAGCPLRRPAPSASSAHPAVLPTAAMPSSIPSAFPHLRRAGGTGSGAAARSPPATATFPERSFVLLGTDSSNSGGPIAQPALVGARPRSTATAPDRADLIRWSSGPPRVTAVTLSGIFRDLLPVRISSAEASFLRVREGRR